MEHDERVVPDAERVQLGQQLAHLGVEVCDHRAERLLVGADADLAPLAVVVLGGRLVGRVRRKVPAVKEGCFLARALHEAHRLRADDVA
jgi:hypothetical protein